MLNLASSWKPKACGQTELPDRSVLIGQKWVENAKIHMRHFGWFSNTVQSLVVYNINLFFSHDRITNILNTMTLKLQKCRSKNFANGFVEQWLNLALKDGLSRMQVKNTISNFLGKTFGQWKYALVVYPPHHGGHKHWTNFDIRKFRLHGHSIGLHFLPLSHSKVCKDPEPIKWCSNLEFWQQKMRFHLHDFYCTHNNEDAHQWFDWIKNHPGYFGHLSALTVFRVKRESDFVVAGQNVCKKTLEVQVSMRHWNFKRITIISVWKLNWKGILSYK